MSELLFDLTREEVYISNLSYVVGPMQRTLEELRKAGLLASPVEWLQKVGYRCNRCVKEGTNLVEFTGEIFSDLINTSGRPDALVVHHSYAENTSIAPPCGSQELLARANYFPVNLLRHFSMDDVPYWGSYSSGCTGFMSLLVLAASALRAKQVENVICLTADLKPRGAAYDSERERLLTSDAVSGFAARHNRGDFQVMGVAQYSSSRSLIPLVEVVKRSVLMTKSLLEMTGIDSDTASLTCHYPNMFTEGWRMVSHFLRLPPENPISDDLAERAHCLSSDSIISLQKVKGTSGRLHAVYSFGSGLHLAVAILKEV